MKIKPLEHKTKPDPWMCFPSWIWQDGRPHKELFTDEASAKEYYTLFFMASNPRCQIEIFQRLMDRMAHAESIFNPYNYDINSLKYAKSVIEHQIDLWKQNYGVILMTVPNLIMGDILTCQFEEGQSIAIHGTLAAQAMSIGKLAADFLISHPGTEIQFNRYILAKIMHDNAGMTKEVSNVRLPLH